MTKATVSQDVGAPLVNLSLTFNGTPGFPLQPIPGNYAARVQMTLPSGAEVFCVDLALKDVAFVNVVTAPGIPVLSHYAFLALLVLVGGAGLLALRRTQSSARTSSNKLSAWSASPILRRNTPAEDRHAMSERSRLDQSAAWPG
jgi:hypothetical protein